MAVRRFEFILQDPEYPEMCELLGLPKRDVVSPPFEVDMAGPVGEGCIMIGERELEFREALYYDTDPVNYAAPVRLREIVSIKEIQ